MQPDIMHDFCSCSTEAAGKVSGEMSGASAPCLTSRRLIRLDLSLAMTRALASASSSVPHSLFYSTQSCGNAQETVQN